MKMGYKLSGFKETSAFLKQMPPAVENRVLQRTAYAGGRAWAKQLRRAAPRPKDGKQSPASQKYGPIHRNIRVVRLKRVRKGEKGVRVHTGNAFWAFFLEFGTRFIAAMPWFKPAIQTANPAAISAMADEAGRGIEREALKLSRQTRSFRP